MKIASFNVENLFDRAKAFNHPDQGEANRVIAAVAELNILFGAETYSEASQQRMLALAQVLGLNKSNQGPLALIRNVRGNVFKRPRNGDMQVAATGRASWVGWAELKTAPVDEIAVLNTGRVIRDVKADILAVVEAENRVALKQFSEYVFKQVKDEVEEDITPYEQIMLIDGNDERGIDVGLMTKQGFGMGLMQSHIHDLTPQGNPIFSRDCPEYAVTTPSGEVIWLLPNHFKSKFGGQRLCFTRQTPGPGHPGGPDLPAPAGRGSRQGGHTGRFQRHARERALAAPVGRNRFARCLHP